MTAPRIPARTQQVIILIFIVLSLTFSSSCCDDNGQWVVIIRSDFGSFQLAGSPVLLSIRARDGSLFVDKKFWPLFIMLNNTFFFFKYFSFTESYSIISLRTPRNPSKNCRRSHRVIE